MSTTLDLIRHGEPVGGRKYRGQVDDPLSETGWAQMDAALGQGAAWTQLVTSPLVRCKAFAERLAAQRALPLTVEPRLREVGFGTWEGKTAAEIERAAPGTLAQFKQDPIHARPPGAEALPAFYERVAAALDALAAERAGGHLLVVAHAGVIRMALAWALAIPLDRAYRIDVATASVTRLRITDGHPSLIFHGGGLVTA